MFERFTPAARTVVTGAVESARRLGCDHLGTEHLLLGVMAQDGAGADALARHGLTRSDVEAAVAAQAHDELDGEALDTLGIDLDAVRARVEATFGAGALDPGPPSRPAARLRRRRRGPGSLRFTHAATQVLAHALEEAVRTQSRVISAEHITLGLVNEPHGSAARLFADRGVDTRRLDAELRAADAG